MLNGLILQIKFKNLLALILSNTDLTANSCCCKRIDGIPEMTSLCLRSLSVDSWRKAVISEELVWILVVFVTILVVLAATVV